MKIINTKYQALDQLFKSRIEGKTIGLIPTMGALHEGHLNLVEKSKYHSDVTVVSIFVNPTQFNNPEDLEKYPRTVEEDLKLLEGKGVDYVFLPEVNEMYPQPAKLKMDFGALETILEGASRPGHFNGVGIVVSKLFHIINPDYAYFGQKDLQQVAIIRQMVNDLSFSVNLVVVPTVREEDGLAMSSRNRRLNITERKKALVLYESMVLAKNELLAGRSWFELKDKIQHKFNQVDGVKLEYFELVETETLNMVANQGIKDFGQEQKYSLCTAAFVGDVRLIDNLPI
ncbi:pantoate--beta-alanine ligase [Echinicola marina]|uniref:pantoate--beta-alanine ligase n=1 Tax=Echinicola marina TaxID=2859768 RepID=UPI001CF6F9CB|nr:pantoate--beta-alanine ligase [Echinicola marina]UCS94498.1 pantoate--beta-alanine ligase [Echinicola marina]